MSVRVIEGHPDSFISNRNLNRELISENKGKYSGMLVEKEVTCERLVLLFGKRGLSGNEHIWACGR